MANTRKILERIPEGKFDWQPHPKSMTLGALAIHLANLPSFAVVTMTTEQFDVTQFKATNFTSKQDILAIFDNNVTTAREIIAATDNDALWYYGQ